uniref:VPS37 C-terminal domain-containing protein n=1 Tax=Globodera pallida TaxID=36090 RepID=A0A183BYZ7_GLOPA
MDNLQELVAALSERIEEKISVDQFLLLQGDRDALREEFVELEQNQLPNVQKAIQAKMEEDQQKQQQSIVDHFSRFQTTIGDLEHKQKDDQKKTNQLLNSIPAQIAGGLKNQKLSNDHKIAEMKMHQHQQQQTIDDLADELENQKLLDDHKLSEMEELQKMQQQTIDDLAGDLGFQKLLNDLKFAEMETLQKTQQQTIDDLAGDLEYQKLLNGLKFAEMEELQKMQQ